MFINMGKRLRMMVEKKIGILTFQNTNNYGAVLQTYALQHYLKNVIDNHSVEVISYYNRAVTLRERPQQFTELKSLKQVVKYLLNNRSESEKSRAVKRFVDEYIELSKDAYYESGQPAFEVYDAIIAGSDQIWNLELTNHDLTYMLSRYNGKGFSYAASIGREDILTPSMIEAIRRLRMVSVREKSAQVELVQQGIETEEVLDPIFLLKKEEWFGMLPVNRIRKRYVLLYQMTTSKSLYEFAKSLAKKKGLVLINANPISYQFFKSRCIRGASPLEWLSLIKDATCVVTNSFHGLAFSINFEKTFYTEVRDNEAKNSSRIQSLLATAGLANRNIAVYDFSEDEIDYIDVKKRLDKARQHSLDYLERVIKNIKNVY